MYLGCEIKRTGMWFSYSEVYYFGLGALLRMATTRLSGSVQCIVMVTNLLLWKVPAESLSR